MDSLSVSAWPLSNARFKRMTAQSDASSSVPQTPSTPTKASYVTGLKGYLGAGPFFHGLLQQGQRIDDSKGNRSQHDSSPFSSKKSSREVLSSPSVLVGKVITTSGERDDLDVPRESPRQDPFAPRGVGTSFFPSNSDNPFPQPSKAKVSRSASMMPPPTTDQDFCRWAMGAGAEAAKDAQKDLRRYHYLTRSQSVDAGLTPRAPIMRKPAPSYDPVFGVLYQVAPEFAAAREREEGDLAEEEVAIGETHVSYAPTRGRNLSPIEEVQYSPSVKERHGDASSISSVTSAQSNLFIHRSVRRAGSTSSFNSGHSGTTHTDDPSTPATSSMRTLVQPRQPFSTLPVIPASPRESQNVFDSEPTSIVLSDTGIASPKPLYAEDIQYAVYDPPKEEQDLAEPENLPTPMFAIPRYAGESEYSTYSGEQDIADVHGNKVLPRVSIPHSRTPSLLARSESVRTELTYLTAQDSRPGSRRVSAARPSGADQDMYPELSGQADGDTTLVDPQLDKRPSPTARIKTSLDSLLQRTRSGKLSAPSPLTSLSNAKWLAFVYSGRKDKASVDENYYRKPAELLFWVGFVAPWCWLIGGWVLARSGELSTDKDTRVNRDETGLKTPHNASAVFCMQKQPSSSSHLPAATSAWSVEGHDLEKGSRVPFSFEKDGRSAWSSADLLASLRGSRNQSTPAFDPARVNAGSRSLTLRGNVLSTPEEYYLERKLDKWVIRCRVAAVASGVVILILVIVALIVMARAL